ncbi:MAG: hypothetical protein V4651_06235 [Bacteroidota bacterium]
MKKLVKSVLMLSIASLAILSSCKKEDDNATVTDAKVDVTVDPASPLEGGVVTLTITCTGNAENNLKSISVIRTGGSSTTSKTVLSTSLTGTSSSKIVKDTLEMGTYTYTVAVAGEKGSPATKTVTVTTRSLPKQVDVTNATPLFGQSNGAGVNSHFMQLTAPHATFSTSTFAANKSNVDLAFFYGSTNKATLTSPSDATMQGLYSGLSWTGANTTSLYKTTMTSAQFDAVATANSDSTITAMAAGVATWVSTVNLLAQGNVILFKTAGNKVGLIKVDNVTGTSANDAELNIIVISQK